MDFTLTDEQTLFRDSVARFIADEYAFERRARIVAEPPGFLAEHWSTFAELGWLGLPIPEADGGLGAGPGETMVLMEQFGRGLVVSPYLSTVVIGAGLLSRAGTDAQRAAHLPAIAAGERKIALAYAEPDSGYDPNRVRTTAREDGDAHLLEGRKSVVLAADTADHLVVSARTSGEVADREGITLFLVPADAPGIGIEPFTTHDGHRAAEVTFTGVRLRADAILGTVGAGLGPLEEALDHAAAAVSAEAVGAMWSVYEKTLEYMKTRTQFGQTLGSFQALQHRIVDVYMRCELAQSMVYEATEALAGPAAARRRAVSAAKYEVGHNAQAVAEEGVQIHGGVGMMAEVPVGHHLKRIAMIDASFGDPEHHLRRCGAPRASGG